MSVAHHEQAWKMLKNQSSWSWEDVPMAVYVLLIMLFCLGFWGLLIGIVAAFL